jgi:CubicO group peptidase (beta-lactamase class C family)
VTRVPYPKLVRDSLFAPLGMTASRYCDWTALIPHRAAGYDRLGRTFQNTRYLSMTQPYAAGALCSTSGDLVRWTRALHEGRVVSRASLDAMLTPTGAARRDHYGFGIVADSLEGRPRAQHSGGIFGFLSHVQHLPAESLTVVVLTNTAPAPAQLLSDNLARIAMGIAPVGPKPTVAIDSVSRARYAGRWSLALPSGATEFRVWEKGGRLVAQLQAPGQGEIPLNYLGDHAFGADFDRSLRLVFTVEGGRATRMRLEQGGQRFEATRMADERAP